jgi:hypothetical protein
MDHSALENYITRYGWNFERYDEVIVAGLETDTGNLLVAFQLSAPWLRLSVPAYAPGREQTGEFYANLLRLNDRSRLVRFALGEDGHVALCVDLFTQPALEYAQFELALDVLSYVAGTALPYLFGESNESEYDEERAK